MNIPMKKTGFAALAGAAALAITSPAFAQDAGVPAETQYILNTFSFLFSGALVMWMAAGFAMLESGRCGPKTYRPFFSKTSPSSPLQVSCIT